jgi:hypothetical protein
MRGGRCYLPRISLLLCEEVIPGDRLSVSPSGDSDAKGELAHPMLFGKLAPFERAGLLLD